jgi:protein HOOK3
MALRKRLNETVEELETLRREHAALDVKFESQVKELTVAKSNSRSPLLPSAPFLFLR